MNAARIAAIRAISGPQSTAMPQSWHCLVGECLDAIEAQKRVVEAQDRVIARLRRERDQALLQLSHSKRPLLPSGRR